MVEERAWLLERGLESDAHTKRMGDDGSGIAVVRVDEGRGAGKETLRREAGRTRRGSEPVHHIAEDVAIAWGQGHHTGLSEPGHIHGCNTL